MLIRLRSSSQIVFAGNVTTEATRASIEIGTVGGHALYISEPDFDSDAWSPAWGVPRSSKRDTPTVLMRHVGAELELPDEITLRGDNGQPLTHISVKLPYLEDQFDSFCCLRVCLYVHVCTVCLVILVFFGPEAVAMIAVVVRQCRGTKSSNRPRVNMGDAGDTLCASQKT